MPAHAYWKGYLRLAPLTLEELGEIEFDRGAGRHSGKKAS
jgi:hypothetical protein